jgi:predicted amidohydrolase YtcJ
MYGDGALGSRGACMHKPYSNQINTVLCWHNFRIKDVAMQIAASKFQLNTHAIGDSANTVILKIYSKALNQRPKMEN